MAIVRIRRIWHINPRVILGVVVDSWNTRGAIRLLAPCRSLSTAAPGWNSTAAASPPAPDCLPTANCSSKFLPSSRHCVRCHLLDAEFQHRHCPTRLSAEDMRPDAGVPARILGQSTITDQPAGLLVSSWRQDRCRTSRRPLSCRPEGRTTRSFGECRISSAKVVPGFGVITIS